MAGPNPTIMEKINQFNNSNDYAVLQEVFDIANGADDIKALVKGNILKYIESSINKMPTKTQKSCFQFLIEAEKENIDLGHTEACVSEVMYMLSINCIEVRPLAFKLITKLLENQSPAVNFMNIDSLIKELALTFNRKTHKLVAEAAIECVAPLFGSIHKEKAFNSLKSGLLYCLNHVDSVLVLRALEAIIKLATCDCAMISQLIQQNIVDQVYSQFGVPENKVKAAQFKFFSVIATCCSKHLYYTSSHKINERIPAFICHFDDECCMSCLDLLHNFHVPVQPALDNKYVVTLVLHVAMSNDNFKIKAYEILKEYIEKANPSEINKLVDEGFIRPFCTLMRDSEDARAKEICSLLLKLVERYNILNMKIARFDFDHAHNSSNGSCVNQITDMLERNDPALKSAARELLSHLKEHDIVLHLPNE